jgi:hypothetical protein
VHLQITVGVQQQVSWLQVAVDNIRGMDIIEAPQNLEKEQKIFSEQKKQRLVCNIFALQ